MKVRVGGLVVGLAALVACSGDGGSADVGAVDSAPVTAAPEATTSAPPSSEPASTTTAGTTAPSTTEATTTTIDPAVALAAEVEEDFLEAVQLANDSLAKPHDDSLLELALARRTGAMRDSLEAKVLDYRRNDLAIRANPDVEPELIIESSAKRVRGFDDLTVVRVCEIDPWIVVETQGAPDGSDAVVDDSTYVYRTDVYLRSEDGVWLIEGANEIGSWTAREQCPT